MANHSHVLFKANDRSYFAILKKEIHTLAVEAGFGKVKVGEIDIVVAELVSNLVKHAGGGDLLVRHYVDNGVKTMELITIDNGPGIKDVNRVMGDGISTKSSLGLGLGTIKRMADVFQVYSMKDWGTIMLVRITNMEKPATKVQKVDLRAIILPKPGETASGDGSAVVQNRTHLKIMLGDGLGHGEEAAHAVSEAKAAFLKCPENDPVEIIRSINNSVRKTRGLVAAVGVFDIEKKLWRLSGVGNISTRVLGPTTGKTYMSYNGIVGLNLPRTMNAQDVPYEKSQLLLMCSDGIKSKWDTLRLSGITRYDLTMLPAAILKDFARNTDDMSVLACKLNF